MNERLTLEVRGDLRDISRKLDALQKDIKQTTGRMEKEFSDASRKAERDTTRMTTRMGRGFISLRAGIAGAAGALAALGVAAAGREFITAGLQLERMRNGLTAVMGSASRAAREMAELQRVAALPGVDLSQAIDASIRLQSVGIEAKAARDVVAELGNQLAIVGAEQELDGVILALSQMGSKGKIFQEELAQIQERLPQFSAVMTKAFGTSQSEDLQAMGLSAKEFIDGITKAMADMPRVALGANTAISNLKNAFFNFTSTFGDKLMPMFTDAVNRMIGALEGAKRMIDRLDSVGFFDRDMGMWEFLNNLSRGQRQTEDTTAGSLMANLMFENRLRADQARRALPRSMFNATPQSAQVSPFQAGLMNIGMVGRLPVDRALLFQQLALADPFSTLSGRPGHTGNFVDLALARADVAGGTRSPQLLSQGATARSIQEMKGRGGFGSFRIPQARPPGGQDLQMSTGIPLLDLLAGTLPDLSPAINAPTLGRGRVRTDAGQMREASTAFQQQRTTFDELARMELAVPMEAPDLMRDLFPQVESTFSGISDTTLQMTSTVSAAFQQMALITESSALDTLASMASIAQGILELISQIQQKQITGLAGGFGIAGLAIGGVATLISLSSSNSNSRQLDRQLVNRTPSRSVR